MERNEQIERLLSELEKKYASMGQDMPSYLEGLLYTGPLNYWDYISTDTLLSLQKPRTHFPDELVFIIYHQITELYFRLVLHEQRQIAENENLDEYFFIARLTRCNRYFEVLTRSFGIMIEGMEAEQFLKFRMSLLPASGFQSAQYRMIEIMATDFINLVDKEYRNQISGDEPIAAMYEHIYWKKGATELATGHKTLTLREFEEKYSAQFIELGKEIRHKNIMRRFSEFNNPSDGLTAAMREFDLNVNVRWPMVHMKSAARYLQKDPEVVAATGGTNWQKYLSPPMQRRIFYPALWNEDELANWGRNF